MVVAKVKRGRKPAFTQKQVDRMKDMRSEGLRHADIANAFGVSVKTVADYMRGKRNVKVG